MKSIKKIVLKNIERSAYQTAKHEADSAYFAFSTNPLCPKK